MNIKIENLKYYWFVVFLILIFYFRLDFTCFTKECSIEDSEKAAAIINHPVFTYIRDRCSYFATKYFPSPHSELLLGMTVGIDRLSDVPTFKQALKNTGTIHVVVVSGFNISLIFDSIIKLLGSRYKTRNLLIAQGLTFLYSLLSGFDPPVVRALVMGSIVSWGKYYGRGVNTLLVLITSGLLMLVFQPLYFFSLSFILSFMATLGLVLFSNYFSKMLSFINFPLIEDFCAGFSAQLLVIPVLSYFFGTISFISIVVNTLILWTVPLTTIIGIVFLGVSFLNEQISSLLTIPLYVLMNIFTESVMFFYNLGFGTLNYKINLFYMSGYYFLLFILWLFLNKIYNSRVEVAK